MSDPRFRNSSHIETYFNKLKFFLGSLPLQKAKDFIG